jgi:hypothetical protein
MIQDIRERYNREFTEEKYAEFLDDVNGHFNYKVHFRVAESPVFFPRSFREKITEAGESIIQTLLRDDFKSLTQAAVPEHLFVPNENEHSNFLALDFAVCLDDSGELLPQLIELQGFPSLYAFQDFIQEQYRKHFYVPENYSAFFNDLDSNSYIKRFKQLLLNGHAPENVILLEIEPFKQSTSIDFIVTENQTGVRPVCITEIIREDRKLFYMRDGVKTPVYRIYNRVIFDEFSRRTDLKCQFHLTENVDVEWAGHPNWFFRISKYVMPFLQSPYVPECRFLHEISTLPTDLENYVLKPLFSFSGTGVLFHLTQADIDAIPMEERSGFLLQRKVKYEPVLQAPEGNVKVEVRLLYFWEDHNKRPELVINLSRLSRGEMIGVKFNKDKSWVGGNVCYFEQ